MALQHLGLALAVGKTQSLKQVCVMGTGGGLGGVGGLGSALEWVQR